MNQDPLAKQGFRVAGGNFSTSSSEAATVAACDPSDAAQAWTWGMSGVVIVSFESLLFFRGRFSASFPSVRLLFVPGLCLCSADATPRLFTFF